MKDGSGPRISRRVALAAALPLGMGCATLRRLGGPPADAKVHVLSLVDVGAGDVLIGIAKFLEDEVDGVHQAEADLVRAEVKAWTAPSVPVQNLVQPLAARGVQPLPIAGRGSYRPPAGFPAGVDARILTIRGRDLGDLSPHTVPGKVTVFDFYADWCGPCRALDEHFIRILGQRQDVALRKLNIVDFNSPLAARWITSGIPFVLIFNRQGKKTMELSGNRPELMAIALGRATLSKE